MQTLNDKIQTSRLRLSQLLKTIHSSEASSKPRTLFQQEQDRLAKSLSKSHCSPGPANYFCKTDYLSNYQKKLNLPQKSERKTIFNMSGNVSPCQFYQPQLELKPQSTRSINRQDRWDPLHPFSIISEQNNHQLKRKYKNAKSDQIERIISPVRQIRSYNVVSRLNMPCPGQYDISYDYTGHAETKSIHINRSDQQYMEHHSEVPGPGAYQPKRDITIRKPRDIVLNYVKRDTTKWILQ